MVVSNIFNNHSNLVGLYKSGALKDNGPDSAFKQFEPEEPRKRMKNKNMHTVSTDQHLHEHISRQAHILNMSNALSFA